MWHGALVFSGFQTRLKRLCILKLGNRQFIDSFSIWNSWDPSPLSRSSLLAQLLVSSIVAQMMSFDQQVHSFCYLHIFYCKMCLHSSVTWRYNEWLMSHRSRQAKSLPYQPLVYSLHLKLAHFNSFRSLAACCCSLDLCITLQAVQAEPNYVYQQLLMHFVLGAMASSKSALPCPSVTRLTL